MITANKSWLDLISPQNRSEMVDGIYEPILYQNVILIVSPSKPLNHSGQNTYRFEYSIEAISRLTLHAERRIFHRFDKVVLLYMD